MTSGQTRQLDVTKSNVTTKQNNYATTKTNILFDCLYS